MYTLLTRRVCSAMLRCSNILMTDVFKNIEEAVKEANHVLLVTDTRPDGDTFGSSLAFAEWLRGLGKRVLHFSPSPIPPAFSFIPGVCEITENVSVLSDDKIDLVCTFDSSRAEAMLPLVERARENARLIVFDHHAANSRFGDINAVFPEAASTCEVVYDFFKTRDIRISSDTAKCLLVGMMTDTHVFGNAMTVSSTFKKTGELLLLGGNLSRVVNRAVAQTSLSRLRLLGKVFERCVSFPKIGAVATYLLQSDLDDTGTTDEDAMEFIDYISRVLSTEVIFFFKELPFGKGVKVSMRSSGPDMLPLAEAFGGGGHKQSCGFTVGL